MKTFRCLSAVDQLAVHLRTEILRGALEGGMPGVNQLAASLGCSQKTILGALKQLEYEGLLERQGTGRRSQITPRRNLAPAALRVVILLYEMNDAKEDYVVDLRHKLQEAGHTAVFAQKSLIDLGMNAERVSRFAKKIDADAWVVYAGSREILEWFAAQPVPAFALYGRMRSVSIASTGPHKSPAYAEAVKRLAELGHRRIVLLTREERRKPAPGPVERAFLEELQNQGLAVGPYNIPDWEDTQKGLHQCLTSLFQHTPPTALIIPTIELFTAAMHFLNHRGIRVPQDVSLVCGDPHPSFAWCEPKVSHIDWDSSFCVRRILRWVNKVASGTNDRRQVFGNARFVEGGTIAPANRTLVK